MNRKIAALVLAAATASTGVGIAVTQAEAASVRVGSCTVSSTPVLRKTTSTKPVEAVKSLQCILNEKQHAGLQADGIFGARTDEAVRRFQSSHNLDADGIVGTKTWSALKQVATPAPGSPTTRPTEPGTSAERRRVLERAATWLTANSGKPVPYSQSRYFQGYRTDCSGYASMALELGKPGTNTRTYGLKAGSE